MKVEKKFNPDWFPWLLENEWTLLCFTNSLEAAQQVIIDQRKVTNAYEYRIVE